MKSVVLLLFLLLHYFCMQIGLVSSFQSCIIPTTPSSSSTSSSSSSSTLQLVLRRHHFHYNKYEKKKTTMSPSTTSPTSSSSSSTTTTRLNNSAAAVAMLDSFWKNSPYTAAALICGVKASLADFVAQKRQYRKRASGISIKETSEDLYDDNDENENENDGNGNGNEKIISIELNPNDSLKQYASLMKEPKKMEWQRNFAYIVYGAIYQGMTQEFVYNHLYPTIFGVGTGICSILSKVTFELLIVATFFNLPVAYLSKAVIYRYSFKEAIRRYIDDIKNHKLLIKFYSLWGPVHCLTFGIVPQHYRITFTATVSFFWLIILSSIASKTPVVGDDDDDDEEYEECSLVDGMTCNIDG